jgi:hypothetical protein
MKTKICLLGIFALVPLAIAAPHTWTFQNGGTFEGDYYSSGTTAVVVRKDGTNHVFQIADLSTNDLAYVAKIKADQKQARLDAEVKQMRAAGWLEFTSNLIMNFPEKVRDQIPGDGTIIHKYDWLDATFSSFNGGKAQELLQDQHTGRPVWIRSPNPRTPELVLLVMIIMLIVKFAIILFAR